MVGSSEVGSWGMVSLSEKVVLVLLAVEAGAVKEGSGFLPSRWVLGRAITACAIKECAVKECAVKECAVKAGAGAGAPDSIHGCCGRQSRHS